MIYGEHHIVIFSCKITQNIVLVHPNNRIDIFTFILFTNNYDTYNKKHYKVQGYKNRVKFKRQFIYLKSCDNLSTIYQNTFIC